jgi:hypothetical protein
MMGTGSVRELGGGGAPSGWRRKNGEKGGEVGGQRLLFSGPVVRAERKRGQGCPGFGTSQVEEEGAGHGAPLELRGARTRAPCGRAAASWG